MRSFFTLLLSFGVLTLNAQWSNNTAAGTLVAGTTDNDDLVTAVSDGAGGSIHFFHRNSDGVFARKISAAGVVSWGTALNPVTVSNAIDYQTGIVAIPDGAGGAFVAWEDYRHEEDYGEIYMQHITAAGAVSWQANGIKITNSAGVDDFIPAICTDGAGGAFITWIRDNDVNSIQVFAQRINSTGAPQWAAGGIQVCTAPGFRGGNNLVSDGSNGFIIFFLDTRNDPNGLDYDVLNDVDLVNGDIYAQRINGNGARLWTNNGVAICTAPGNQEAFMSNSVVADGAGGAILAFDDGRVDVLDNNDYPTNYDLYAQKVNSNGAVQWANNGVAVNTLNGNYFISSVCPDGAGGIVVVSQGDDEGKLLAQRVSSAGAVSWAVNGIEVSTAAQESYESKIIADGLGNFIVAYVDEAAPALVAQKLSTAGALLWTAGGVPIHNTNVAPRYIQMVSSLNGSAIVSWTAYNTGSTFSGDVFAAKLLASGLLDGTTANAYETITNGNWNNAATWKGGAVPPATADVTVKHAVTVSANTSCKSLKVETATGRVTVQTGMKLTVTN